MDRQIVSRARSVAGRYGRVPSAYELREITRLAHILIDEGRPLGTAVEYAALLVLRPPHEDPPWR